VTHEVAVWLIAGWLFSLAMITAPLAPLFDPDEGYYPATAAESLASGQAWDPRFNGAPRWDKPVLTYALIQSSFLVLGENVPAARLPSAVLGGVLIVVVGVVLSSTASSMAALLATVVLASVLGVQVFTRVAHPEIAVVTAVTIAELLMACWLTIRGMGSKRALAVAIGFAVGLGILAKGPVALVLPALVGLVSVLRLGNARAIWPQALRHAALACLVALIIAVPWYAAMTMRHGRAFLEEALWQHNVRRYAGGAFRHPGGLFYFVLPTLLMLFPWTAFLPGALRRAGRHVGGPRDVLRLVMAASALTAFVFYSLSASKLPHYALAVIPPLAILIALSLDDAIQEGRASRGAAYATALLFMGIGVALLATPWLVNRVVTAHQLFGGALPREIDLVALVRMAAWPAAALLLFCAVGIASIRAPVCIWLIAAGGALAPGLLIASASPLLRYAYPWQQLGNELRSTEGPVWMVGPRAPSLTFFAGRPVIRFTSDQIEELMSRAHAGWLVADTRWLTTLSPHQLNGHTLKPVSQHGTMSLMRVLDSSPEQSGRRHALTARSPLEQRVMLHECGMTQYEPFRCRPDATTTTSRRAATFGGAPYETRSDCDSGDHTGGHPRRPDAARNPAEAEREGPREHGGSR
jgi:4-amino-4-deoxy-L-arabinose transferase-like glycosyltransferase